MSGTSRVYSGVYWTPVYVDVPSRLCWLPLTTSKLFEHCVHQNDNDLFKDGCWWAYAHEQIHRLYFGDCINGCAFQFSTNPAHLVYSFCYWWWWATDTKGSWYQTRACFKRFASRKRNGDEANCNNNDRGPSSTAELHQHLQHLAAMLLSTTLSNQGELQDNITWEISPTQGQFP